VAPGDGGVAEADGKLLDGDAAVFGGEEVAELVEKDDEAEAEGEEQIIRSSVVTARIGVRPSIGGATAERFMRGFQWGHGGPPQKATAEYGRMSVRLPGPPVWPQIRLHQIVQRGVTLNVMPGLL
jgi:hypothetical protein